MDKEEVFTKLAQAFPNHEIEWGAPSVYEPYNEVTISKFTNGKELGQKILITPNHMLDMDDVILNMLIDEVNNKFKEN